MVDAFYRYTNRKYAEWLEQQRKTFENIHGMKLSGIDAENILVEKILKPNNINLTDVIKPIEINRKWKRLRLKI